MITQKILILGITGNLAKLKILPSIGKYFAMHKDKVNIEIYGYSRSEANLQEIKSIISANSGGFLPYIELGRGSYSNNQYYFDLIENLKPSESLTTYLALPPALYLDFLKSSCPYSKQEINILIEKPFGDNTEEARQILEVTKECGLNHKIHFLDHYMFKSGTQIKFKQIGKNLGLDFSQITKITVQALETVDVKERAGYYDTAGAIKDMIPHLISLFRLSIKLFGVPNYDFELTTKKLETSQYEGYKDDVENPKSNTETYFKATLDGLVQGQKFEVELESGKRQFQKLTQVQIQFQNNKKLIYEIAPSASFKLYEGDKLLTEVPILDNLKDDHVIVFEDVLQLNFDRFINQDMVLKYWQIFDDVAGFGK
jgi:glucose-6-phosphate 1-dehydrogenase